jgi:hypothetical protein
MQFILFCGYMIAKPSQKPTSPHKPPRTTHSSSLDSVQDAPFQRGAPVRAGVALIREGDAGLVSSAHTKASRAVDGNRSVRVPEICDYVKADDPQMLHGVQIGEKPQSAGGRAMLEEIGCVGEELPTAEGTVGHHDRLVHPEVVCQAQRHPDVAEGVVEAEGRQDRSVVEEVVVDAEWRYDRTEVEEIVLVEDRKGDLLELPGDDGELVDHACV